MSLYELSVLSVHLLIVVKRWRYLINIEYWVAILISCFIFDMRNKRKSNFQYFELSSMWE